MKTKEIFWIIISIFLMAFITSFLLDINSFFYYLLFSFLIIGSSILAKKIVADYVQIKIEHTIWNFKRYGLYERSYFKKPIPIGLILPFFLSLMSTGIISCFTFLQFNPEAKKTRVTKRIGRTRFTELTDWHIASITIWAILANLALALIALIIKQQELAKLSTYYILWNIIPLGNLDGTKLFFGSRIAWFILATISLIMLVVVLLI